LIPAQKSAVSAKTGFTNTLMAGKIISQTGTKPPNLKWGGQLTKISPGRGQLNKEGGFIMKTIHENISQDSVKTKSEYRDRIDLLRSRVGLLTGKDKVLMTMYIDNGNSFRQMARLAGVNEASIARRIHKVTKRLINGEYIMCLRNRDKFGKNELDIAKDYFLAGLSMKKIAKKHSSTYYSTRKTLKKIQALIKIVDNA
jgi:predicted DNA-binding protein YlxM (UPF0122 family)